ncbi:MAG: threonylcarbamoyl-AMP synthase [Rickettsiales bacterium]|nr:threonylcarbamoyl-AMP synthase [Rickettsiales bacterium]
MLIIKNISKEIQTINNYLQNDGVICFPTETVYALACDATRPTAINKLYKIKNRDKKKQFSILMSDLKTIEKYAAVDNHARILIKKFSPGAITYILKNKKLSNWPQSLGIRIPNHPIAQSILKNYPTPLVGTSVNISGQKSARVFNEIPEVIKNSVDIIVTDTSNTLASGLPSTIVDLSISGKYKIIRKGEISKHIIHNFMN